MLDEIKITNKKMNLRKVTQIEAMPLLVPLHAKNCEHKTARLLSLWYEGSHLKF